MDANTKEEGRKMDKALEAYKRALETQRPICRCGGYAILGGKCADCIKKGGS